MILLLISPDFIASDYCHDLEMGRALERHNAGEATVIPVILRPVDWQTSSFSRLQALPRDGKAVTTWENRDSAFTQVAQGIRRTLGVLKQPSTTFSAQVEKASLSGSTAQTGEREVEPEPESKRWRMAAGFVALLFLIAVGFVVLNGTKKSEPDLDFKKAETFLGRLHLRQLNGSSVTVDHRFRSGDFFRLTIDSNRDGWVYVFHQHPGGELKLLWPEDPEEAESNAARAYEPLIVPPDLAAFQFTEETGDEFFYVGIAGRPEAPAPETTGARDRLRSTRTAVRSLGQRRNVIVARPSSSDPNLYFKAVGDGRIAVVEFSLLHEAGRETE